MTTRKHKLDLNREDNPLFYEIIDEEHSIMDEWNRIGLILQDAKIPRYPSRPFRKVLRDTGKDIQSLQKRFLKWNAKAFALIGKPDFTFSGEEERELGFLHFSNVLRYIRSNLDSKMEMLVANYNRAQDVYTGKVNYTIAIISFIVTFLSLVFTLYSIRCAG